MKYIKLFEGLNDGYEKVNITVDYLWYDPEIAIVSFNEKETNILTSMGFTFYTEMQGNKSYKVTRYDKTYCSRLTRQSNLGNIIVIRKLEDEWYYLMQENDNDNAPTFYKCDQWDGLLNCINNECLGFKPRVHKSWVRNFPPYN